eukprot:TRINITY_DN9993_c0_g1_i2.p1 TRINITY_DN9993_c0_g1~~TRINITY_DN9993_c0_g1_i2.p1  ORF type:complete len:160 (+),score=38.64 TRINITY_DN9993_c0_g1_i2:140-619(+)
MTSVMGDTSEPSFRTTQEEIEYWKLKYEEKDLEWREIEEQFADFQQSSKDLEQEMEKDLEQTQKQLKDMTSKYHRLKSEHDDAMDKTRRVGEDSGRMIHTLQEEAEALRKSNKELKKERQKLEQENDDLERKLRQISFRNGDDNPSEKYPHLYKMFPKR